MNRPCVLVFSGADPSGGAGTHADCQAIAAMGAHALPVITALTVQDNERVHAIHPVDPAVVTAQARALIDRIEIAAVKVGVIGSAANAQAVAALIGLLRDGRPDLPVVLDPVLASGAGDALAAGDAREQIRCLLPLATLVTPNIPEALALTGSEGPIAQAAAMQRYGCPNVLIKGGHASGPNVINRWFGPARTQQWEWPRLPGSFHGSGCTLAAAIAARLALRDPLDVALARAQAYCHHALEGAYTIAPGQRIPDRRAQRQGKFA